MYTITFNSEKEFRAIQDAIFMASAFSFNHSLNTSDVENARRAYDLFVQLERAKEYANAARARINSANQ